MFSEKTKSLLRASGWAEDRDTDISIYRSSLAEDGFDVHTHVEKFLREFGGLKLVYNTMWGNYINFDLEDTSIWPQNIRLYSELSGISFCPVGEFDEGQNTILMSLDGSVYVQYPNGLTFAGSNAEDGIEALMTGKLLDDVKERSL